MTTRYLTTDQNGNGDQTYWDINGYFLHGPSGEKLNLGGGNTTVTASNEIVQIGTSYLRIPQGVSNERPVPSYAGMIRYLTDSHVIEYYDGNLQQWLPISQPPPTLNTVSPAFFNIGTDNSFNLTGSSFGLTGASIVVIGNNGSGTIINSTVSSVLTESSALVQFDASATQNLTDISNELPFAMRITNNNSSLSSLLQNAITNANVGPIIIQPNPQTVPFQTFPVQDPSASFTLIGEDESSPTHYPFQSITITSGTAGGITDVSFIDPSGAFISVPSGNKTLQTAGTYPFNVRVVDGSGAFNNTTLTLALADPIVTSIVPSSFAPGTSVDLSVNGNYFVNDSGVSYVRQSDGSVVTPTTTYKSINLLETNVTFSNEGVYDISVNNGSVFKLYTSVLSVFFNSLNLSGFAASDITTTYLDSGGSQVGSPDPTGETVVTLFSTSNTTTINGSITPTFTSSSCQFLLVGGGGGGGTSTNFGGGGGAGGYRYLTGQTLTASTTYNLQIGGGGSVYNGGGQTNFNGGNICDGGGRGGTTSGSPSNGGNGGSGGGGSGSNNSSSGPYTNYGTATGNGTGNRGGGGGRHPGPYGDAGGGGGGANQVGGGNNNTSNCTKGGDGLANSITGVSTYYAGGGAGRGSAGGLGGGGGLNDTGSSTGNQGTNGTGGGGQTAAVGGNGVIIIRFPTA